MLQGSLLAPTSSHISDVTMLEKSLRAWWQLMQILLSSDYAFLSFFFFLTAKYPDDLPDGALC